MGPHPFGAGPPGALAAGTVRLVGSGPDARPLERLPAQLVEPLVARGIRPRARRQALGRGSRRPPPQVFIALVVPCLLARDRRRARLHRRVMLDRPPLADRRFLGREPGALLEQLGRAPGRERG
jgi:hypothetical protein